MSNFLYGIIEAHCGMLGTYRYVLNMKFKVGTISSCSLHVNTHYAFHFIRCDQILESCMGSTSALIELTLCVYFLLFKHSMTESNIFCIDYAWLFLLSKVHNIIPIPEIWE